MSRHDTDDDALDRELPDELAAAFGAALGTDEPPRTLRGWVDAVAASLDAADLALDPETLCTADESRHAAAVDGETRHFRCVLDALMAPFLFDDLPATVRSVGPDSGETVAFEVAADGVDPTPESAVVSLGVAADATSPDDGPAALAYGNFCPYVNAFPDRAAYESWAATTDDAVTVGRPPAEAFAAARALVEAGRS